MQYGELHLKSASGLNEVYCFSNPEFPRLFQKTLSDDVDALRTADSLLNEFS